MIVAFERKTKGAMVGRDGEGAFWGAVNVVYLGDAGMLTLW